MSGPRMIFWFRSMDDGCFWFGLLRPLVVGQISTDVKFSSVGPVVDLDNLYKLSVDSFPPCPPVNFYPPPRFDFLFHHPSQSLWSSFFLLVILTALLEFCGSRRYCNA